MSDDSGLPRDPFSSYDTERVTRETGGEHVAILRRGGQDRLAVGVYRHRHLRSLDCVTIRMWLDGKPTDGIDLGPPEVLDMIVALREATVTCWPATDPPFTGPATDWDQPPPDDPDDEDGQP
jgi:hypothetical protein